MGCRGGQPRADGSLAGNGSSAATRSAGAPWRRPSTMHLNSSATASSRPIPAVSTAPGFLAVLKHGSLAKQRTRRARRQPAGELANNEQQDATVGEKSSFQGFLVHNLSSRSQTAKLASVASRRSKRLPRRSPLYPGRPRGSSARAAPASSTADGRASASIREAPEAMVLRLELPPKSDGVRPTWHLDSLRREQVEEAEGRS